MLLDRTSLRALVCAAICASAACAEELFVAIGENGERAWSADGVRWELAAAGTGRGALLDIAYGAKRFVAVGGDAGAGRIVATTDGRDWREVFKSGECIATIAFGKTAAGEQRFVAASGAGLLHSSDGEHFVSGPAFAWPATIHPRRSAFGDTEAGRLFVIIGDADFPGEKDRVSWRCATGDGTAFLSAKEHTSPANDIAYGAGRFLAVGSGGMLESSHDGQTWTRHPVATHEDFTRIVWSGSRFIASGASVAWTSADGVAWTAESWSIPGQLVWGCEDGSRTVWFAIGERGSLHRSTTPRVWKKVPLPPGLAVNAIASHAD